MLYFLAARMPFLCTASGRPNALSHAWRVVAAGLCFVVFGLLGLATAAVFALFVRLIPQTSAVTRRRWAHKTIGGLSRVFIELLRLLGLFTYRIDGAGDLDTRGAIIVANHPSLIDALLVLAYTPHLCCVVKPALYKNPCTSYLVRTAGYLRSDSPMLIEDAAAVVNSGENLLLFPEGTRNTDDMTLAFRRGAAHVSLQANAPLLPVSIDFYPRALQKGGAWYAIPREITNVIVRVLPSLDPYEGIDADLPMTLAARRLTQRLRQVYVKEVKRFAIHNQHQALVPEQLDTVTQPLVEPAAPLPTTHSSLDSRT